jgi:type IV pilus assembly protein PilM
VLNGASQDEKGKKKILLATVPNEVINQYGIIAQSLNLVPLVLEPEVFSLVRSLVGRNERGVLSLIDVGARSTTCSIIYRRTLRVSHSFDISGNSFIERVSKALSVSYEEAQELIQRQGLLVPEPESKEVDLSEILLPLVDLAIMEIEKVINRFYLKENQEVEKIVLSGGISLLPGLRERFQEKLNKDAEIANPFSHIFFPPILDETLRKMGPSYAVALGVALRGLE